MFIRACIQKANTVMLAQGKGRGFGKQMCFALPGILLCSTMIKKIYKSFYSEYFSTGFLFLIYFHFYLLSVPTKFQSGNKGRNTDLTPHTQFLIPNPNVDITLLFRYFWRGLEMVNKTKFSEIRL